MHASGLFFLPRRAGISRMGVLAWRTEIRTPMHKSRALFGQAAR
jgi:hypothetical protein